METTKLYRLNQAIELIARAELVKAVKAHGSDEYIFNPAEPVIVTAISSFSDNLDDYYVTKVAVTDNTPFIYGSLEADGRNAVKLTCLDFGHTEFITGFISPTAETNSAAINQEDVAEKILTALHDIVPDVNLSEIVNKVTKHD